MTPIRANMVGPVCSTTRSRALPLRELLFGLGELLDVCGGILERDELETTGQGNGIIEAARPRHYWITRQLSTSVSKEPSDIAGNIRARLSGRRTNRG
jgi:hypothetical protein